MKGTHSPWPRKEAWISGACCHSKRAWTPPWRGKRACAFDPRGAGHTGHSNHILWAQQPKGQSQPPAVTLRPHQPVCDYGRSGAQERFFSVINFNAIRFQKSESARSYPSFLTTPRARPGLEKPLNSPRRTPCAASAHLLSAHAVGGTPVAARASVKRHAGEACECHSKATLQPIPRPHYRPFPRPFAPHALAAIAP